MELFFNITPEIKDLIKDKVPLTVNGVVIGYVDKDGKAVILDTPNGKKLISYIHSNPKISISSRKDKFINET